MLTIALSKGRLMKDFIKYLESLNIAWAAPLKAVDRELLITVDNMRFLLVKGDDVPTYVEEGVADIGITGSDILSEQKKNVNHLLDLPFGYCHFAVAAKEGVQLEDIKVVASKYVNIAEQHFRNRRQPVKVIPLKGSVELAALIGMSDAIVDIVQSGDTLRMNQLVEKERMNDINARLITNKHAYFTKNEQIQQILEILKVR